MKAFSYALVCLCVAGIGWGQAGKPSPAPEPTLKTRATTASGESSAAVSADSPVVTVDGLCRRPPNSSATPADCRTVITRADFERVIDAVQPNMPAATKKQFVSRYVVVLLLAEKAHEMGLDQGPDFDEQMRLARLQTLARLAGERMQREASQISESDIEGYYRAHTADFKTISFDRLYVPKQKQVDNSTQKPNDPDAQKKREESEAAMKEEADKLRARAAAGEDFAKLQQEAYDFANYKLKAPNTRVENVRKASIPPGDVSIFDLKKGDVSQVFNDPAGYMIYKVAGTEELPLASVREEIARALQAENARKAFDELQGSVKTTLNDSYFAVPAPPSLKNPGEQPAAEQPAPGKK